MSIFLWFEVTITIIDKGKRFWTCSTSKRPNTNLVAGTVKSNCRFENEIYLFIVSAEMKGW